MSIHQETAKLPSPHAQRVPTSLNSPLTERIWQSVASIQRSPGFARSPRLQELLRYLVTKSLCGEAGQLKETTVAAEFYGQGSHYDPQFHSLVRVEILRLRRRLDAFYAQADHTREIGATAPVRILLVPGSYLLTFELMQGDGALSRTPQTTAGSREGCGIPTRRNRQRRRASRKLSAREARASADSRSSGRRGGR